MCMLEDAEGPWTATNSLDGGGNNHQPRGSSGCDLDILGREAPRAERHTISGVGRCGRVAGTCMGVHIASVMGRRPRGEGCEAIRVGGIKGRGYDWRRV